jgi:hypothetical protein
VAARCVTRVRAFYGEGLSFAGLETLNSDSRVQEIVGMMEIANSEEDGLFAGQDLWPAVRALVLTRVGLCECLPRSSCRRDSFQTCYSAKHPGL